MAKCSTMGCEKQATRKGMCDACYMREYRKSNGNAVTSANVTAKANGTGNNGKQQSIPNIAKDTQAVKVSHNGHNGHNDNMDVTMQLAQSFAQMVSSLKTEQTGISEETRLHLDMVDEELAGLHEKIEALEKRESPTIAVKVGDLPKVELKKQHEVFERVLRYVANDLKVYLVGPAGSGKTTLAMNIAKAMQVPFYMTPAILLKYDLLGFVDAAGTYHETPFYRAYKDGGIFLFDEIDASSPEALVAFNAAIENGHAVFPCGTIEKHKDFRVIAAANTFGIGATRQYVGRNQLDAATLNRFVFVEMGYDEALEMALADPQNEQEKRYLENIRTWRKRCEELRILHIISPRQAIMGIRMLRAGAPMDEIEKDIVFQGLEKSQVDKIKGF